MTPLSPPVPAGMLIDTTFRRSRITAFSTAICDFLFPPPAADPAITKAQLLAALNGYLCMEIDEIEMLAATRAERMMFKPSPELLIKASEDVETTRERIEKFKAGLVDLPKDIRGMMEAGALAPMEDLLRQQEGYLTYLQKAMEEAEAGNTDQ